MEEVKVETSVTETPKVETPAIIEATLSPSPTITPSPVLHQEEQLVLPSTPTIQVSAVRFNSNQTTLRLSREQIHFIVSLRKQFKTHTEIIAAFQQQFNRTVASPTISYWTSSKTKNYRKNKQKRFNRYIKSASSTSDRSSSSSTSPTSSHLYKKVPLNMISTIMQLYHKQHFTTSAIETQLKATFGWSPKYTTIRYHINKPYNANSNIYTPTNTYPILNTNELIEVLKYKGSHQVRARILKHLATKHNIHLTKEQFKEILKLNSLPKNIAAPLQQTVKPTVWQRIVTGFKMFTQEVRKA